VSGVLLQTTEILRASPNRPLRQALLEAAGAHRDSHPIAYWQHDELSHLLAQAYRRIGEQLGKTDHPERQANERPSTEVAEATANAAADGDDITAPERLTLLPWSNSEHYPRHPDGSPPEPMARFRVPFIPLGAAVADMMAHPTQTVSEWLDERGIAATTTSFETLDILRPHLHEGDVKDPQVVASATLEAHRLMGEADINLAATWLHRQASDRPDAKVEALTSLVFVPERQTKE